MNQPYNVFSTISTYTSVTSDKLTIHQAASSVIPKDKTYRIQLVRAVILATVAGTVTIERSGTAPTTTAVTPAPVSPGGAAARATAFRASNVGAGTALSVSYVLAANTPLTIDLEHIDIVGLSATNNVTISVALGSTGNGSTQLIHRENF